MGFFSNDPIFKTPVKPSVVNKDGNQFGWKVLVARALDMRNGKNLFDGKSKDGPVKVLITNLDGFISESEFRALVRGDGFSYIGTYYDSHVSVLRGLIESKLQDPAAIRAIERNNVEGIQIIYSDNPHQDFNNGLDDLIKKISFAVNSVAGEVNTLSKRFAEKYPDDMLDIVDAYNSWVRLSGEIQEALKASKRTNRGE